MKSKTHKSTTKRWKIEQGNTSPRYNPEHQPQRIFTFTNIICVLLMHARLLLGLHLLPFSQNLVHTGLCWWASSVPSTPQPQSRACSPCTGWTFPPTEALGLFLHLQQVSPWIPWRWDLPPPHCIPEELHSSPDSLAPPIPLHLYCSPWHFNDIFCIYFLLVRFQNIMIEGHFSNSRNVVQGTPREWLTHFMESMRSKACMDKRPIQCARQTNEFTVTEYEKFLEEITDFTLATIL